MSNPVAKSALHPALCRCPWHHPQFTCTYLCTAAQPHQAPQPRKIIISNTSLQLPLAPPIAHMSYRHSSCTACSTHNSAQTLLQLQSHAQTTRQGCPQTTIALLVRPAP
eukprot:1161296-Pelagomonas_calceolata.AAC.13